MKKLKLMFFVAPFFILSCASPYLKNYEPVLTFLETQKLDKHKFYILQRDKISNTQPLRIFNGNEGFDHVTPLKDTHDLFNLKHWKKLYNTYANDTVKRYWRKEDFIEYNFTLEDSKLLFSAAYDKKYPDGFLHDEIIWLSEPMYYWNKKYILFSFNKGYLFGGTYTQVIIMKKEKKKWVIVEIFGDYIYH